MMEFSAVCKIIGASYVIRELEKNKTKNSSRWWTENFFGVACSVACVLRVMMYIILLQVLPLANFLLQAELQLK